MLRTRRRQLQVDFLEGKVLLSVGMADPAKMAHRETVKPFLLSGALSGLPEGSPGVNGFTETSFPVSGHVASMGSVSGSFELQHTLIPIGKLPNLAGATLTLENSKGSIQLAIAPSKKQRYDSKIVSGSDAYAAKSGSGTLKISSPRNALDLVVSLHTKTVKKA
jgi:hypothetical protein